VRLDDGALLGRQGARLQEDRGRDADLADVVEESAQLQPLELFLIETQLDADPESEIGDPPGVRRRVLVVGLEGVGERLDRGDERSLERLVAPGALEGELRLLCETAEQLELTVREHALGRDRGSDDSPAPVDAERGDRETSVGVLRWRRDRRVVGCADEVRLRAADPGAEMLGGNDDLSDHGLRSRRMRRQPHEIPARGVLKPQRRAGAGEYSHRPVDDPLRDLGDALRGGDVAGERE
jgi:hypothetical protein